jgi:cell volume regulation protein A
MISIEILLLGIGLLILTSILLSKVTSIIGIPTLIIFLIVGMLLGSDGIGGIYFDDYITAQYVSIFALIIIIFSGGLETDTQLIKPVLKTGISLSTIGVLITTVISGLFIHFSIGLDLIFSLLIGSIISSTDVAAVFSLFRPFNLQLKNKIDVLLELESGTNDPMSYLLTTTFIYLSIHPSTSIISVIFILIQSLALGTLIGYFSGKLSVKLLNSINLDTRGLYPVLLISIAILTFACSELVGGNGFLAIYISSLLIGNSALVSKRAQINFFDGLAWLMQMTMFIILGLLVFPKDLISTAGISLIIAIGLILIARPLSVFTCLIPSKFKLKEKIFISWTGIKGAVPIVFATYPLAAGIPQAHLIFNIVFFVTIISVLLQGSTVKWLARKMGLVESIT